MSSSATKPVDATGEGIAAKIATLHDIEACDITKNIPNANMGAKNEEATETELRTPTPHLGRSSEVPDSRLSHVSLSVEIGCLLDLTEDSPIFSRPCTFLIVVGCLLEGLGVRSETTTVQSTGRVNIPQIQSSWLVPQLGGGLQRLDEFRRAALGRVAAIVAVQVCEGADGIGMALAGRPFEEDSSLPLRLLEAKVSKQKSFAEGMLGLWIASSCRPAQEFSPLGHIGVRIVPSRRAVFTGSVEISKVLAGEPVHCPCLALLSTLQSSAGLALFD